MLFSSSKRGFGHRTKTKNKKKHHAWSLFSLKIDHRFIILHFSEKNKSRYTFYFLFFLFYFLIFLCPEKKRNSNIGFHISEKKKNKNKNKLNIYFIFHFRLFRKNIKVEANCQFLFSIFYIEKKRKLDTDSYFSTNDPNIHAFVMLLKSYLAEMSVYIFIFYFSHSDVFLGQFPI